MKKSVFLSPKESLYEMCVQLPQWFQRRRFLKMMMDDRQGTMDAGVIGTYYFTHGPSGEPITNAISNYYLSSKDELCI